MTMRPHRIILIVLIGASCFVAGYFNQEVSKFFLNKDALIGLLSTLLAGCYAYTTYLEKKNIRRSEHESRQYEQLEELRYKDRNRKDIKELIKESKTQIVEEMHKLAKELKTKK